MYLKSQMELFPRQIAIAPSTRHTQVEFFLKGSTSTYMFRSMPSIDNTKENYYAN